MNRSTVDRRGFLRRSGLAAAALPLLGCSGRDETAPPADPDQLFQAGSFDAADRGYAGPLRQDPGNAHAAAQRGYIALLSNRFGDAERFLTTALKQAPGDTFSRQRLADCFVRQDQLARAVPLLRRTGNGSDAAAAEQYAAIRGTPYQVHGAAATRVPIREIDPLPVIEASANGGPPRRYVLDTGATSVALTQKGADELGLRRVASTLAQSGDDQIFTQNYGVLKSFRIGEIELRNIPVTWGNATTPAPSNGPTPVGAIGTVLFYHFLTTMDYAGRGFILRQRTAAGLRNFQAAAKGAGIKPLPLWLAATHIPCTLGSLNDFGPRVVSFDTGASGIGISTTAKIAQQAKIAVDHTHPRRSRGMLLPSISPDRISLGDAVGRHVPGVVTRRLAGNGPRGFQFQTIGNFTHEFFKPFAITFDYVQMNLYISRTPPDRV